MIDQFIRQGIDRFCIAPGSRNTPLVIAAAEHPQAKTIVHYDERGLGFYALGYAKGAKKPAAIITTSGTAAGNLLPSVMEAHHSSIPMLLLTTDRPAELRDCGANQTTDQAKMFSHFVRWQADLNRGLLCGLCRLFRFQPELRGVKLQRLAGRLPGCGRARPASRLGHAGGGLRLRLL